MTTPQLSIKNSKLDAVGTWELNQIINHTFFRTFVIAKPPKNLGRLRNKKPQDVLQSSSMQNNGQMITMFGEVS